LIETAHEKGVSRAQARKTCLIVAGVLLPIAAWNFYRGRMMVVAILGGIGLVLVLAAFLLPPVARLFHIFWMKLAGILGYVNSRILLSLTFYGLFAPYGFISRLIGRDPLNRRKEERDTYWVKRKTTRQTKEQFERLF
jgi:hypothetical protein